ncbi:MAG TPA: hypothetical protein VF113_14055 [Stellaceae bacterium]
MLPIASDGDTLASVRAFAATIVRGSWFAACGEPLTASEQGDAAAYLAALGMPGIAVAAVTGWAEAAATTKHPDWSRAWWEAETHAQGELQRSGEARFGAEPLLAALTQVTEAAAALSGVAALALSRAGIADPMLTRVASGAAAQACHQAALAVAAAAGPDHLFAIKFRLFAAGRWPLGIVGDRFFVL